MGLSKRPFGMVSKGIIQKAIFSHCFATHLMDAGVGIRYIQGIKTSKTTLIYTYVTTVKADGIPSPLDNLSLDD